MIIKTVIMDKIEGTKESPIFINSKKVYFLGIPIYTGYMRRE